MVDEIDRKILNLLKKDSRLQFAEIGRQVHLSAPAVFSRVKKLEAKGVIRKFSIEMNPETLEASMCAFIRIVLKGVATADAVATLEKYKEIEEAHHVAGEDCLVLKVRTQGALQLNQLLETIKRQKGVERTVTSVVLKSEFERGLTP
ncbi:MAG: Lrp/AsnC family transcriptional regulator [Bacteriovoracia bacterium]